MNIDSFWRHDDTLRGYYLGVTNIDKAVFIQKIMQELFDDNFPGWTISFVYDREELQESMEKYLWKEN